MKGKLLKTYCYHLADRLSLVIYASKKITVSFPRVKRFARRLYRSARHATTEEEANDCMFEVQKAIIKEYEYHSLKMWNFCGKAVVRLSLLVAMNSSSVKFSDVPVLRKRLFRSLSKASNDHDVNARASDFFKQVLDEYTEKN